MTCLPVCYILKKYNRKYILKITQINRLSLINWHIMVDSPMYLCADSTLRASQVFSKTSDNLSWISISVRLLSVKTQAVFLNNHKKKKGLIVEILVESEFPRGWLSRTEKHCGTISSCLTL